MSSFATPRVLVFAMLLTLGPGFVGAGTRVLEQSFPADEVDLIQLKGGNGSVTVSVGAGETIGVRVEVGPKKASDRGPWSAVKRWFLSSAYDDLEELIAAIALDADPVNRKLRLGLTPSIRSRDSKVNEHWHLTVPERLAVRLSMAHARTSVEGISGGVEIELGNGSVDVDVPGGDLDIDVLVGKIEAQTGSSSVGDVELRSQVGNTRLRMNGMRIDYTDPPGPGSEVSMSGDGEDSIRVTVKVGDASLRVNEP